MKKYYGVGPRKRLCRSRYYSNKHYLRSTWRHRLGPVANRKFYNHVHGKLFPLARCAGAAKKLQLNISYGNFLLRAGIGPHIFILATILLTTLSAT